MMKKLKLLSLLLLVISGFASQSEAREREFFFSQNRIDRAVAEVEIKAAEQEAQKKEVQSKAISQCVDMKDGCGDCC